MSQGPDTFRDADDYTQTPLYDGNYPLVRAGGEDDVSLIDLLIVLVKHKLLVFGLPLVAGILTAVYTLTLPNQYTATAKILPPQQSQGSTAAALLSQIGAAAGLANLPGAKTATDVYIAMLKSRTVADNLIQRFDLMKVYNVKYPTEARRRLAGATLVEAGKDGLITVEFLHENPETAATFANAYIEELVKLTQVLAVTEASQRRLFFEQQFAQAKNNLAKAEGAAREALAQRGIVKVDEQGRAMIETTARLRGAITVKEVQIGAMRTFATDENAELRMAQRELEAMRRELARMEGDDPLAASGKKLGNAGMESLRKLRDVKYHEVVFEALARQFELAKLDEAKDSSVIQVLDAAVPPDFKSHPKRLLIVLGVVLVTGVLAVLAAFIREGLLNAGNNPQQARRLEDFRRYLSWR